MLAKLIAHAPDRNAAIRKLRKALSGLCLSGVGVNRDFLADVLAIPDFLAGEHLTSLLEQTWPQAWPSPQPGVKAQAEAVLIRHLSALRLNSASPWQSLGGWRLGQASGRSALSLIHI